MIAVAAVCTFATRVAPFLLFNGSKPIPPIIRYLGGTLPPAVIALLVVYCLFFNDTATTEIYTVT